MELTVTSRIARKKSEAKRIRREGNIPAVVYSRGEPGQEFVVEGGEFRKILNAVEKGTLSTKIFTLKNGSQSLRVIIKDIQYDIVTYNVIHLDFEELHEDVPVNVNVPIHCLGTVDCVGVKLGGVLRQVLRSLRVRCLPKDIPAYFEVDVRDLNLNQGLKLGDIALPNTVRPLVDLNQAAVVVSKR